MHRKLTGCTWRFKRLGEHQAAGGRWGPAKLWLSSSTHHVYMKQQKDGLCSFRLRYVADIFSKMNTGSLSLQEQLIVICCQREHLSFWSQIGILENLYPLPGAWWQPHTANPMNPYVPSDWCGMSQGETHSCSRQADDSGHSAFRSSIAMSFRNHLSCYSSKLLKAATIT